MLLLLIYDGNINAGNKVVTLIYILVEYMIYINSINKLYLCEMLFFLCRCANHDFFTKSFICTNIKVHVRVHT